MRKVIYMPSNFKTSSYMNDDLLFKQICKVLLSLLFILLISRIDKCPLDTSSVSAFSHLSQEISFIENSAHTVDNSLFLIPLCFDHFITQSIKYSTLASAAHPTLIFNDTTKTIFCKHIYHNRSNQVLTKVLLI